jgi:hypothetical protein
VWRGGGGVLVPRAHRHGGPDGGALDVEGAAPSVGTGLEDRGGGYDGRGGAGRGRCHGGREGTGRDV